MAGSTQQSEQSFVEKRAFPRRKMLQRVGLSFGTDYCSVNAVLRNVSNNGGYLDFSDGILIPDNFKVYNEFDGYKVDCAIVRRNGNSAGIRFVGPVESHVKTKKQVVQANESKATDQAPEIRMQHLEPKLKVCEFPCKFDPLGWVIFK